MMIEPLLYFWMKNVFGGIEILLLFCISDVSTNYFLRKGGKSKHYHISNSRSEIDSVSTKTGAFEYKALLQYIPCGISR